MIADALIGFVFPNAPLSLVAGAGVDIPTDPYDIFGAGAGNLVSNIFGNTTTAGQADALAAGMPMPYISVIVGTALTTGTAATMTIQFQGAPDNGSSQPGTWATYAQTGDITAALGVAGAELCRLPFIPPTPINNRPRFLRLNFQIPAGVDWTAGTILSALVVGTRDDQYNFQTPKNYVAPRFNA